jgi:predicted nucleic acid-binding protein
MLNRAENLTASGVTESEVRDILDELARVCIPVRLAYLWRPRLKDANDDMVLETAANGNADAIITFNLADFRGIESLLRCDVIAPREALVQLRGERNETQ